jgi:selenocysteine-specific elongation factor
MQSLVPREAAVRRAGLTWSGKPLDRIVAALSAADKLKADGTGIRLPSFKIALTERQRSFLDRVVEALGQGGASPPSPADLAQIVHAPPQAVEEILRLGVEAGEVYRVADGIFFTPGQIAELKEKVRAMGKSGPFTAAQFRDAVGTTRKFAIPLLEHFDSIRFTVRVGDQRALVER